MRTVDPDDLNQLAKLLNDKGGVTDKLAAAFTSARYLGVTEKLSVLKPIANWSDDTAADLRRRAGYAYLENNDPLMALTTWAGLRTSDAKRRSNESLSDWEDRIKAKIVTLVPGLAPYEKEIAGFLGAVGDVKGIADIGGTAVFHGVSLGKVLGTNSLRDGWLASLKNGTATAMRASGSAKVRALGSLIQRINPALTSVSAPGTWLPSKIGALFSGSTAYRYGSSVPFTSALRARWLGAAWDLVRSSPLVRSLSVGRFSANGAAEFLLGSDELAAKYGGVTHSGQLVTRSGNASLWRIARSQAYFQKAANARPSVIAAGKTASPLLRGLSTAGKAAGFLRGAGIAGSIASTGFSTANVIAQGNPVAAFKKKGAGYVADVAEVGFNASMTAAMIAPNPVTIGLAVGTGLVYGGAKVVEHWDDITKGAGKAANWVGDKASKVGDGIADGAKTVTKHLNPKSWF